jgi:chemotaxis protein CheD
VRTITVGISNVKVSRSPDERLTALGLGSCIGLCAYDRRARVAGMSHIMLPDSGGKLDNVGKYADTAVPALIAAMEELGASRGAMLCAFGGGAEVFSSGSDNPALSIGSRNIRAVRAALRLAGLRVLADDVGGNAGRTIALSVATGLVSVTPVGGVEREIAKLG